MYTEFNTVFKIKLLQWYLFSDQCYDTFSMNRFVYLSHKWPGFKIKCD